MKRILIVDDEYFFRQGFKNMIPWDQYGCEVFAEAKNGQEALEIIMNSKPDLVFLDISMPIMDGMELMKHLYNKAIKIPVVLLTGYGEFEYARQAIRYGAREYLLKPVESSDVCKLLEQLSEQTDDHAGLVGEPDIMTLGMIKDKLLMDLINGNVDIKKEKLFNRIAKISLSASCYCIVLFRIAKSAEWSPADLNLWKYGVSNIIQEMISDSFLCGLFSVSDTDICGVLWENGENDRLDVNILKEKCKHISKSIYNHLGIKVYTGIGSACSEVLQIRYSYSLAEEAVESRLLFPESVVLYTDVMSRMDHVSVFSVDEKKQLLTSLYSYDKDAVCRIVNNVFDRIKDLNASMAVVKNVLSEFSSILSEAAACIPNNMNMAPDLLTEMYRCETAADVCLLVGQVFITTSERMMQSRPSLSTAQKTVERIKAYIEQEYCRPDFNESEISKNMYLTRNYMCSVFKKVTGITIGKYIDAVRVEKAKALFMEGNTVVQSVSEKVGFSDSNYFGKFFKKQTGLTPSQFINIIKK